MNLITANTLRRAVTDQKAMVTALFDQLRQDGLDEPGVSRDPYGAGEQRGHATVTRVAEAMGLAIENDVGANLYMTMPGRDRALPQLIIGSHLDSVPHGGNFDGAAGVLAGLVTVAALRQLGLTPARDIVVMGIRAEESIWFQVSYIGSRSALGMLPDGTLEVRRVDTGRTLAEHMTECGGDPERVRTRHRHLDPARLHAYLELHIEQAPSLIEAGRTTAICTGIPGNFRYPNVWIEGSNDHVGLPRRFRHDSVTAGAEFAMAMDTLWAEHEERGIPMACTIGRFHTDPNQHGMTIVPGSFNFSLDVRAYEETVLAELDRRVDTIVQSIEQRRGVRFHMGTKARAAVGKVDPTIKANLEQAAREQGVAFLELGSPASHDAAAFAEAGVPMGMLFVRNQNGSHNPREAMDIDDFLDTTAVLAQWTLNHIVL